MLAKMLVQFAFVNMEVHLMLISMVILTLLSRKHALFSLGLVSSLLLCYANFETHLAITLTYNPMGLDIMFCRTTEREEIGGDI